MIQDPEQRKEGAAAERPDGSHEVPEGTVGRPSTTVRESLQGWIPELATPAEIRTALEKAFDYRGDVAITLKSGERLEGYVFDRRSEGPNLDQCCVRMLTDGDDSKRTIPYNQIARLEFTGKDTAAGKSFEAWIRKYRERKERGEKNVFLAPEPLD